MLPRSEWHRLPMTHPASGAVLAVVTVIALSGIGWLLFCVAARRPVLPF